MTTLLDASLGPGAQTFAWDGTVAGSRVPDGSYRAVVAATDADPVHEADRAELRNELNRCLAEIAPEQARVVVLKDALGLSFEEIAAVSDMPVGTAKCYAHRGRNRLRDKLTDAA